MGCVYGISDFLNSACILRREARGAYHLFGGGVTYKSQLKDQLEVVQKHLSSINTNLTHVVVHDMSRYALLA